MSISQLPTLHPKETAAAIRKILRANFPATKFSVVTERGSMVSSVRIAWTDGPTPRRVDVLVAGFEAGRFDGMTDCYDYDNTKALVIEGVAYRPGCRYIFTSREISPALATRCIQQVAAFWGGVTELPTAEPSNYGTGHRLSPDGIGRRAPRADLEGNGSRYDWSDMIHQVASDRTQYNREG